MGSDVKTKAPSSEDHGLGKVVSFVEENSQMPEILRSLSEEEFKTLEKKLLRKVDLRLLPTMILIYIMNYLDRYVSQTRC